jgi:ornithine cyclodeaminase
MRSLGMPAYVGGEFQAAGMKVINSNPLNLSRNIPRASGLTLLFDPWTARIVCAMEGGFISALRTASVSALAMHYLAADLESLAVIGTGVIGTAHIEVAARTFPRLKRVLLFDIKSEAARTAAQRITQKGDLSLLAVSVKDTAVAAVREADVVVPATTVTSGYIPHSWLKTGALVVNVSLDDLLPDAVLRSDLLFVDDWNLVKEDSRRLLGRLYRAGALAGPRDQSTNGKRRVDGELGDLVAGKHLGRTDSEQRIIVNPFGLAIEDIAFASRVFRIAEARGLGTYLSV